MKIMLAVFFSLLLLALLFVPSCGSEPTLVWVLTFQLFHDNPIEKSYYVTQVECEQALQRRLGNNPNWQALPPVKCFCERQLLPIVTQNESNEKK